MHSFTYIHMHSFTYIDLVRNAKLSTTRETRNSEKRLSMMLVYMESRIGHRRFRICAYVVVG